MTDRDIEVDGQSLVIKTDGRVVRSPVPPELDPKVFRHIVAAVDMLYREAGVIPDENAVMASWEGFSRKAVQIAMASEEIRDALSARGIEWDVKLGLTALQLNALLILQDPTDARSTSAKLKDIGVSMSQYRAWQLNPGFKKQMTQQSEKNLGDAVQMAINRMIANAEAGDNQAIKMIFEMSGRHNPQQQAVQNAEQVIRIFIEALEKHASPEVLRSVQEEVMQKTRSLTIVSSMHGIE